MADVWLYPDPSGSSGRLGIMNADNRKWEVGAGGVEGTKALPPGDYKLTSESAKGQPECMQPEDMADPRVFRLWGLGPLMGGLDKYKYNKDGHVLVWDPLQKRWRDGLLVHYKDIKFTHGCVGYKDPAAQQALLNDIKRGDKGLHVHYVKDRAEAEAKSNAALQTSKIKNGATMTGGEPSVVAGSNGHSTAHVNSPHSKGGKIRRGVTSIRIGPAQEPVGYVDAPTTDGSEVATGAGNILVVPS